MAIKYDTIIDFARPNNYEVLVVQGDHLSRVMHFILRANGKALDVSDVSAYTMTAVKADGSSYELDGGVLDKDDRGNQINEITYEIPQAITETIGACTCSIGLTSENGALLQSFEFYVRARNELKNEDDSSDDSLAGFRDILARAQEAVEKIEELSSKSKLPNPESLRITIGNKTQTYDGSNPVSVTLTGIAYLSEDKKSATPVTWTS